MSINPLTKKLQIKKGERITFINPPENYIESLNPLPEEILLERELIDKFDFIQIFVKNSEELKKSLLICKKHLKSKGKLWVSYYKGSSKINTDINRDSINNYALTLGLKGVAIISIDKDWSAVRFKVI